MRGIKFRGKAVADAEGIFDSIKKEYWVYGNLVVSGSEYWIIGPIVEAYEEYVNFEYWYMVDPETVGQYAGVNDRAGNEIYEGDILSNGVKHQDVYWSKDRCNFSCNSKEGTGWSFHGMGGILTISGNIHDNPELLK